MAGDPKFPSSDLGTWINDLRAPAAPARTGSGAAGRRGQAQIDTEALDNAVSFSAEHARRYVETDGEDDGWAGPRPILVLYTKGRRTGQVRRNPLLCFEHDGERYVIGSLGGAPNHPVWYLNLLAEPRVTVRLGADLYDADARTVSTDERARLWPELVARYPMFADYQANTEREIPMVHLRRAEPDRA